jgi:hypothetical protein
VLTALPTVNPEDRWHTEILGNLFSIQDNDHKTAVSYPEGAGRIDGKIKRLTGMGDGLYLTYWTNNQVYFRYDNGLWDTTTKDDGHAYGLCNWSPWTRDPIDCSEKNSSQVRVSYPWPDLFAYLLTVKISDLTCVFRC